MRTVKWTQVLMMCAAMAYGKQAPYYNEVVSGDGLLGVEETIPRFHVDDATRRKIIKESERIICISVMTSEKGGASGYESYEFMIDGTPLALALTNGIVVGMSRNGKDVGIKLPELTLRGKADWVDLSTYYHAEAWKLLPFTHFLGIGESMGTNEVSVIGRNVAGQTFRFVCGASGRARLIHHDRAGIRRIHETENEKYDAFMGFPDDVDRGGTGWGWVFSADFDKETGCLSKFSRGGFAATFFPTGGLRTLYIADPETHEGLSERKWNEKGELIHERDLKKDPYPDFDLKDARMFKGGREVGRSEP